MKNKVRRSFLKFQRTRDPKPLSEVFDALAADLLLAAVHLAHDADSAEDLVQETFLTAIERVESFDSGREVMPWFMGILSNHAQNHRRKRHKAIDADRIHPPKATSPVLAAEGKENRRLVFCAIEKLEEPYRQTLILSLGHGLSPADIAHVQKESPGTVRVRIHRGLERLKKSLPAGVAVSGLLAAPTLAAVRETILAKASLDLAHICTTTSLLYGGALVTKKLLIAATIVVGISLATWFAAESWTTDDVNAIEETDVAELANDLGPKRSLLEPEKNTIQETPGDPQPDATDRLPLSGTVIDGITGKAIANADLEVYSQTIVRAIDLQKRWGKTLRCSPCDLGSRFGWPAIEGELSDVAIVGRESFAVKAPPSNDSIPGSITRSDELGAFSLSMLPDSGILRCRAEGFVERLVILRNSDETKVIKMWRAQPFCGVIMDPAGNRIREKISLVFRHWPMGGPVGPWTVTTDSGGEFEIMIGAPRVQIRVLTPGYALFGDQRSAQQTGSMFGGSSLPTGNRNKPAFIVLRKIPTLKVRDARTKRPIEDIFLQVRETRDRYIRTCKRIFVPDGVVDLSPNQGRRTSESSLVNWFQNVQFEITVWSDGYASQIIQVTDFLSRKEDVLVDLIRGSLNTVNGVVTKNNLPLNGAAISALGHSPLQWTEERLRVVDASRSRADGSFQIPIPEGEYLLRIAHEGSSHCRLIRVPLAQPLTIDLDRLASIEVLVQDTNGKLMSEHTVVLAGDDGRNNWATTNSDGKVHFSNLPGGKFSIRVPNKSTKGSFVADHNLAIDLAESEIQCVTVTIPSPDDCFHPRLIVEGQDRLQGWKAQFGWTPQKQEVDISEDGVIPIKIPIEEARQIDIVSPDGYLRQFSVPKDPNGAWEIRIPAGGNRYLGRLLSWSGNKALKSFIVRATMRGSSPAIAYQAKTDAKGSFAFRGMEDGSYTLAIENPAVDRRFASTAALRPFIPTILINMKDNPTKDPVAIDLRIPLTLGPKGDLQKVKISGQVFCSGSLVNNALVGIRAIYEYPRYVMSLALRSSLTSTQADGSFVSFLPRGPKYRAFGSIKKSSRRLGSFEWKQLSQGDEIHQDIRFE